MKLEFNPKILSGDDEDTIYLLDEPGSYLHASAQSKLCSKLKSLSKRNRVIYCTHSHYLLDPEVIPLSKIRVADKDEDGNIALIPLHEHKGALEKRSAFQPVIDALRIKPYVVDLTQHDVVITEGIFDYYALEMMKGNRQLNFLPSAGADSIPYYVSLMIAWGVKFCALWDNDKAGREARGEAEKEFGDEVASKHFFLLASAKPAKNTILQDLFAGPDLRMIRSELGLPSNSSFEKTIASLFFAPERQAILSKLSRQTRDSFAEALNNLQPS